MAIDGEAQVDVGSSAASLTIVGSEAIIVADAAISDQLQSLLATAVSVEDSLGAIVAALSAHVRTLPSLVCAIRETDGIRLLLRGAADALVTTEEGEQHIAPGSVSTWVEHMVDIKASLLLRHTADASAVLLPGGRFGAPAPPPPPVADPPDAVSPVTEVFETLDEVSDLVALPEPGLADGVLPTVSLDKQAAPNPEPEPEAEPDRAPDPEPEPELELEREPDPEHEPEPEPELPEPDSAPESDVMPAGPPARPDVEAIICDLGHPNPLTAGECRTCRQPLLDRTPQLVPRPTLGRLVFTDGLVVNLERPALIGRAPSASMAGPGLRETPQLIALPSQDKRISRLHAEVRLEGWHVYVLDSSSLNGTTIMQPGLPPRQLLSGEPLLIEPGTSVNLGGAVTFTVEGPNSW